VAQSAGPGRRLSRAERHGGDYTERLATLEQRLERQADRRDGWVVVSFAISALAMFVAIVAVAFGVRAIDESKDNVAAAGGAPQSAAASTESCQEAAGFPDGTEVQDEGTEPASGPTVSVEAGDSFFGPTCTSGVAAGTVTLTVHNSGQALHNVSIADQGIDEDVEAGETITVQVTVGSSPVQFECKYHRTSGMVGALLPAGT
jgi:plastocyanin